MLHRPLDIVVGTRALPRRSRFLEVSLWCRRKEYYKVRTYTLFIIPDK